jgi:hypothetical protein
MLMVLPLLARVTLDPAARLVKVGPLTTTDPLDMTTETPPLPTIGAEDPLGMPVTPVILTSMAVGKVRVA